MNLRDWPIRRKIVAVTMFAALSALWLTGGALFLYELFGYQAKLERDVATLADIIGANSAAAISFGDRRAAAETLRALRAEPQILEACLFNLEGERLATFTREDRQPDFPAAPGRDGFAKGDGDLIYFGSIHDAREQRRVGTLYFRADFSGIHERLRHYAGILALVLTMACLFAFALSSWLQRFISEPIVSLANATVRVSTQRDYAFRVPQESGDELGRLVGSFNAMLEQIELRDAALHDKNAELEAANKELESFSYSVSHDLRAPLRHVQGYASMLQDTLGEEIPPNARRCLTVINDASVEMGQLIDDLLEFSRMGRSELRQSAVALDDLVQECVRSLEMSVRGRNIEWKISPLSVVEGDAAMLRQVLANLLSNAVKYTRKRDPAEIEIGVAGEENNQVVIVVRDNGAGFEMAYVHKLFGVFQRLHRSDEFEGTGIGLATVRRIVARHGGRVWAEGAPDRGAAFYFTVRRAPERPRHP